MPPVSLLVGAGPVGLALAGDLGWRGIDCLLIEQSDGAIQQPKMDLVGIRTMEHCRRWGIVKDVENSPYPRDYPQDNVYLTSLGGYELGREQFPPLGEEKPPPQSPQKRERCPQNLFDPILRAFAGRQRSVELQYLTKLMDLRFEGGGVVACVRDERAGEERELVADFVAGCDGAHSTVRELLGIRMLGNPALTYTTNIIFRCADLAARHPGRKPYRYILLGPEGTWATIVAINGGDQWRMSIIGGETPRDLSTDNIHAAIRRAIGPLLQYEILTVVPWVRKELVAESYRKGPAFILGDAAHVMSPTGAYGMNTGIGDAVDLSWKLAAVVEGWGGETLLDSFDAERRPIAVRNVKEASGNLRRMLSPGRNEELLDDTEAGAALRRPCWRSNDGSDAPGMVHARHAPRISLRRLARLRSGRNSAYAGRYQKLHSNHAARQQGTACLAGRQPLDARPVRQEFCAVAAGSARAGRCAARAGGAAAAGAARGRLHRGAGRCIGLRTSPRARAAGWSRRVAGR